MNTAMSINPFYCEPCTRDFLTHDGLQSHMRSSKHYQKSKPDRHQIESNSTLKNRHDLAAGVHIEGNLYCSICKRMFNTNSGLLAHVKTSKSHGIEVMKLEASMPGTLDDQVWPCEVCGYIFPTEEAFEEHWESLDDHQHELHSRRRNSIVQAQEIEESSPLALDDVVARSQALHTTSNGTSMAPAQLASRVLYCDACERQFDTEKSLKSHLEKSKVHKKEVKRRAKEMEKAAMMASDMGSSMQLPGHQDSEKAGSSSNVLTSTSTTPRFNPSADGEGLKMPSCRITELKYNGDGTASASFVLASALNAQQSGPSVDREGLRLPRGRITELRFNRDGTGSASLVLSSYVYTPVDGEEPQLPIGISVPSLGIGFINDRKDREEPQLPIGLSVPACRVGFINDGKDREEPKLPIGLSVPACRVEFINDGKRGIGKDGIRQESKLYPSADQQQSKLPTASVSKFCSVQDTDDDGKRGASKDSHERWSSIRVSEQLIEFQALKESCHSLFDLQKNQYLLYPFGPDDIAGLRRCRNCNGLSKNIQNRTESECIFHPRERQTDKQPDGSRPYVCCGEVNRGCESLPVHIYKAPDKNLAAKHREFSQTPEASLQKPKRKAITLDCEMVGVKGLASEVALLCAADYLTGEILVNSLVRPTKTVLDWRTRYSGVTAQAMATATVQGEALKGWKGARDALWEHIDAETILIGHALQNDLEALRIIHTCVVDSAILTRNAVGPKSERMWGLKTLCDVFLNIEIQNHGSRGHNCQEDAMAAREVVLWCMRNPQSLKDWAADMREEERLRREEREKARKEREEEKEGERLKKKKEEEAEAERIEMIRKEKEEEQEERLRQIENDRREAMWSRIDENYGWPESNAEYDPWYD